MRVVVVGAGIAGLVSALRLSGRGAGDVQVTVLDGAARVGGKLATGAGGLDVGAESLLARRPQAVDLVREIGLGGDLVHPGPAAPAVWSRGALHPLPAGLVMGVPVDDAGAAAARDLTGPVNLDAASDPQTGDVAVGTWLAARLGRPVVDRLVEPLLGGVYAGYADRLSLRATVPALWPAAAGGAPLRSVAPPRAGGPVFAGVRGGVGRLPEVLADRLVAAGVIVRARAPVRALERSDSGWRLELGAAPSPEFLDADAVLLAVPAPAAAKLLAGPVPAAAAELAGVATASVAVISVLLPAEQLAGVAASGVLVPPVEGRLVKAVTFSSIKWPWLADRLAGPGLHAVRLSVGRLGEEATLQRDDADLTAEAVAELAGLLGRPALDPVSSTLTRWGGALPQYTPGHLDRVTRLRRALAGAGGLAMAGATLDGLGVAACIASADRAVTELLEDRLTTRGRIDA